jgi:nucleoside-diphosphate-sugar epimerase
MKNKSKQLAKPRVLILGCGDVGLRVVPLLLPRYRVFAVTTKLEHTARLRDAGAIPLLANLDQRASLARLTGLADCIIHCAPPRSEGEIDTRSRNLIAILPERSRLVYISTTGVYGDCQGEWLDETRCVQPANARARRRVSAEQQLRAWAIRSQSCLAILRVPGIYAENRLPLERLQKGTPALSAAEDVYTNHIHADDLARIIVRAMQHGRPNRVYHASDDSDLKMGEYFDLVASHFNLPAPPRLPRSELQQQVSPMLLSFMSESRRLRNQRIKQELGVRLRYATVAAGLQALPGKDKL